MPVREPTRDPDKQAEIRAWRKADPVLWFFYHGAGPSQRECLFNDQPYRLIEAPNGAGKTTVIANDAAAYARGIHPVRTTHVHKRLLMVVPDKAHQKLTWGDRWLHGSRMGGPHEQAPLIPPQEVDYVSFTKTTAGPDTPSMIRLKNGFEIHFYKSGDEQSYKIIQGLEWDAIYWDESVGTITEWEELRMRIRKARTQTRRGDAVGAGYIVWAATETVRNEAFTQFRRACQSHKQGHIRLVISITDNPDFDLETRQEMAEGLDSEIAAARLMGKGSVLDPNKVYAKQWNPDRHIMKLTSPYRIGKLDNLWVGIDPGWDNPFGMLIGAISPDKPDQIKLIKFLMARGATYPDMFDWLKEELQGRRLEGIAYDPAAHQGQKAAEDGKPLIDVYIDYCDEHGIEPETGWHAGRMLLDHRIPIVKEAMDPDPDDPMAAPKFVCDPHGAGMQRFIDEIEDYQVNPRTGKVITGKGRTCYDTGPDCLSYLLSVDPCPWVHRGDNIPQHPTTKDYVEGRAPIPKDISPEMRAHLEEIKRGIARVEEIMADEDREFEMADWGHFGG